MISERQLNRSTLARQLLLRREALKPLEAVRRIVAIQAQDPASPYIALWTRLAALDAKALHEEIAANRLVKATLMRVTLHLVHGHDYPAFHAAMQRTLRAARLHDKRFKVAGMSVDEVEALIPELVAFAARPRSNAEIEAWLDERAGRVLGRPGVWWALRHFGPFVHAPVGGPWSFGPRPLFRAGPAGEGSLDAEAALRRLITRYLEGFGPATADDICQFGAFYKAWVRPVLDAMAGTQLVRLEGPGGRPLYDAPGRELPAPDVPAPPRLLPMWDSILLAYADRTRVIPAEYRRIVIQANGDLLPTLLVDGYVRGVWRPVEQGIEATAFERLSRDTWRALEAEAVGLRALLAERDALPYRRYARWWTAIQAAEKRVLP
jgi:hypothetical protein